MQKRMITKLPKISIITPTYNQAKFIQQTIEMNASGMLQMQNGLNELHIDYIPSFANFITINCQRDAATIANQLETYGIIARELSPCGMPHYLRITIGTQEQNTKILHTLKSIFTE